MLALMQDESQIDRIIAEAHVLALASHLYWCAWAILQAKWSSIEFDYMGYAVVRLHEYYKRKEEFIDRCKQVFNLAKG